MIISTQTITYPSPNGAINSPEGMMQVDSMHNKSDLNDIRGCDSTIDLLDKGLILADILDEDDEEIMQPPPSANTERSTSDIMDHLDNIKEPSLYKSNHEKI